MRPGKKRQGSGDNGPPCLMLDHASIFMLLIHTMSGCKTFIYVHLIWRPGRARSSARLSDRLLTDRPWVRIPPGPPLSIARRRKFSSNNRVYGVYRLAHNSVRFYLPLISFHHGRGIESISELFSGLSRLDPRIVFLRGRDILVPQLR